MDRLILAAIAAFCVLDLLRSAGTGCLRILLIASGATDCLEGIVRYLHWEFGVRGGYLTEIAVTLEPARGECLAVTRLLERDGLVTAETQEEPSLVFRI